MPRSMKMLYRSGRVARQSAAASRAVGMRQALSLSRRLALPGIQRTGGYYGRFGSAGELKFFDTALSFNVDTTGEVPATGQLSLIPQGVTQSTRIGRKCTVKSIQIVGMATSSAAVPEDVCYVYVVLDKQCNGAAAAATDVLTNTSFAVALPNLENSERFVILKKIKLHPKAGAGVAAAYATAFSPLNFYKKVNIQLDYDSSASTGALGTIRSNNIFLLAGATLNDDGVAFNGTCRLRFSDD